MRLFRNVLIALCLCLASAHGQFTHTASTILPQVGQRGTTVEVWIRGSRLETAREVLFYQPGIQCTKIAPLLEIPHEHEATKVKTVAPGEALSLTLEIAPDARLGEYFLRIRTDENLSEMLSFWVTPFPTVFEENPYYDHPETGNHLPENAQPIPLNSTVIGYQGAADVNDVDTYRIALTQGQRGTAQILNARLGTQHYGGLTDMAIEVTSSAGKRVARSDDSPLFDQDPVVSWIAPEAGDYLVTVRQQMDLEEAQHHYALHLGDFARPMVTYPLGGPVGETLPLTVFNQDGTMTRTSLTMPAEVADYEAAEFDFDSEIPESNHLKVAAFANVMESDKRGTITLPIALNGNIATEGEKDWYRISAKKGERYRVRTFARTLSSPLDPFLWIRPAEGTVSAIDIAEDDSLWDHHDWEGHHYRHQVKSRLDAIVMFEPDADGDYLIGIGDTRREWGDDYVYRIEIAPHEDSLFVYYPSYPSKSDITRDTVVIPRGRTVTRPFAIQNGFGSTYDGPVRVEAVGLPDGIEFECPMISKGQSTFIGTFSVAADAENACGLVDLKLYKEDGSPLRGGFVQTNAATNRRGDYAMVFKKTRQLSWAIVDEPDYEVSLVQPTTGLAKNAELELEVKVARKDGFDGAIYAEMDWLPGGITKQPPLVIPAGETTGRYKLSATSGAQNGSHRLTITARENEGGDPRTGIGFHFTSSEPVTVAVTDPFLTVTLARVAIEQGKAGTITGTIEHLRAFEGAAEATLLRLPAGVELVEPVMIKADDREVTFALKASGDALTGQYQSIACEIAIQENGQEIRQQTGDGVIRIDASRTIKP